ncbi:SDR family NAD(P)-dependent oxidoreductase [Zoogloea sp.]|uniref:SDR family NAD(P)-dependent oxidoreductase n=1 Tax=Zoogloea sp. TaxID=49181 RepID=UPI0026264288|nr:SDR family NAD(P)-dependent oxidoreductase [Zoogloea sp.]MDD3352289.1 SDR family NAD(P)-dependent oxidoreductase [Zoogloea sp.]
MSWFAPLNTPITDWQDRRVWIVGASTGIGAALAVELNSRGARLALSARNGERLRHLCADLRDALALPMDVTDAGAFTPALMEILDAWGGVDLVIFNAGTYEPLRAWELTTDNARHTVHTNLLGVMDGAAAVLPQLLLQGHGALAIVGSVAGYRGLPRALAYGPSKAALINFAETLYLDLAPKGVSVFLINPGFVATPLTAQNDFEMPALLTAADAAQRIVKGFARGGFEIHFPKRFTGVLKLMRLLPARWYFRLISRGTGL